MSESIVKLEAQENILHGCGWLKHLSRGSADKLMQARHNRAYATGDTIYAVGQDQQSLFGIQSGLVRMFISVNDHPLRFAHMAGPGFWFGEFEFIMPQPRVMEMVAAERVDLTEITRDAFDKIALHDPEAWHAVAVLAGLNQAIALGAADDLMLKGSAPRLVSVLLRLAGHRNAFQGTPPIDRVPVTQRELADAASLSLSKTAAILADLARAGAIATDYNSIRILDVQRLHDVLQ